MEKLEVGQKVKLPYGISLEEWRAAEKQICFSGREGGIAFNVRYPEGAFDIEVTIQCELNKALADNAALTAQVEEKDNLLEKRFDQLADMSTRATLAEEVTIPRLEAELAAMREGAKVHYRVDVKSGDGFSEWALDFETYSEVCEHVKQYGRHTKWTVVELITRERILDGTQHYECKAAESEDRAAFDAPEKGER